MVTTTTPKLWVKPWQSVAEVTEGTTPSSPNFSTLGAQPVYSFGFKKNSQNDHPMQIGQEDVLANVQGPLEVTFKTGTFLTASAFAKRAVNSANFATPAGTVSEPLTQFYSYYLNGVEYYRIFKGSRPQSIQLSSEIGKPITSEIQWVGLTSATPATTNGFTTPTLVSTFPSAAIWTWLDGGAGNVTWNSGAINATKITVSVNRNTKPDPILGQTAMHSSQPYDRAITFQVENLYTDTTIETDFAAGTERTLAWVLKTATSTLTLSSAIIDSYQTSDVVANGTETIKEMWSGTAKTASLT